MGTASVDITQPASFISAINSSTNISCFGGSDGSASILVNGGTGPYNYSWSPGVQTNSLLANVPADTYTGSITDANGCIASSTVIISQPQALVLSSSSVTNVSCNGGNNGQIVTTVNNGTPGYTYVWTPALGNNATVGALTTGAYTFSVTDANGCSITSNFNVTEPSPLTSGYTSTPATCNLLNGSATATVGGGTPGYLVTWNTSPTQSGLTASNIAPGTWTATITDAKGCILTQTANVANPPVPTITGFVTTSPKCFGFLDGTIQINYSAGTGPYTVAWSNPISQTTTATSALTQSVAGVASGSYYATLTDSYGCSASLPVVVAPTSNLTLISTVSKTICFGQTAQISATGSGGTGAYSYTWSPTPFVGGGPHTITPTVTTVYNVAVSDANGCSPNSQNITITVTPSLALLSNSITLCDGKSGLLIPVMTSNGNGGPYSYTWSPGGSTTGSLTVTGHAPISQTSVNYSLSVSDGCTTQTPTIVFTVTTNPEPTVNFVASSTVGCAPSAISFTATPGTLGSYTYKWESDGKDLMGTTNPVSYTFADADSVDISVTITNTVTGCFHTETKNNFIIIHKLPIAAFYAEPQPASILDPNIHFINTSQGATTYYWDFGDVNATATSNNSTLVNPYHYYNLVGVYNVHLIATSPYGCQDITQVVVEVKPDYALYIPNSFSPDGNGLNDMFQPAGVGVDEENYRMDIYDRWGEVVFTSNAFRKGWDGTVKGGSKMAEQGVYVYKLMVRDTQGTNHPYVGHVTLIKKEN